MRNEAQRLHPVEKIIILVVIISLIAMVNGWRSCHRIGGTYVRGLFWMECIR